MHYKAILFSILLVLTLFPNTNAQDEKGLSPEAREALTKIVSDPRFPKDNPEKYVRALPHVASLKQKLQSNNLISNINYIYGWSLPETEYFKVEQGNDLAFEIVMRPKYNEEIFLSALRIGDPLLRKLRSYGCLDKFNTRFDADIPATGGLSTAQAEHFLYDVISKPIFNSETVMSKLCDTKVSTSSETSSASNVNSNGSNSGSSLAATPSTTSTGAQPGNTERLALIIVGGIVIVGLIVIVILRFLVELKRN
jgi:hypothetical protein